jgi:hypothetical protein
VAANLDFKIPPHTSDHPVQSHYRFSHDMLLYQLAPHMHFRGKSFRYEAVYPGGSREILLDVPRYDFNWQNSYRFAQPKLMPEGTILRCTAHFDNSADNLSNPDPSVAVMWGEQTWDEMMIGFFEGIYLNQDMTLPRLRMEATDDGRFDVRFSYRPDRPVRTVHVAGTFNEWSNSKDPMKGPDEKGFYHGTVRLAAGDYRYKFVLDGNFWTHDPSSKQLTGFLHESYFVAGGESQR